MVGLSLTLLIIVCAIHAFIGMIVVIKNPKDRTNLVFGGFIASVIGWLVANYFSNDLGASLFVANILNRVTFIMPGLALYFLLLFMLELTRFIRKLNTVQLVALSLFCVSGSLFAGTNAVVAGIIPRPAGYEVIFGPLSPLYFGFLLLLGCFIFGIQVVALRRLQGQERARLQYISLTLVVSTVLSLFTNAVLPVLSVNYYFSDLGPLSTVVASAGFGYTILRYRLFDIRFVVARSITYILLLTTLGGLYGFATFTFSRIVFPGDISDFQQELISTFFALIFAFTFQPLRRGFEILTDRIFYRAHYDSQEVLHSFSNVLASERELDQLLRHSLKYLCRSLNIEFAQVIVFDAGRVYRIEHFGPLPHRLMVAPELKQLNRPILVADELNEGDRRRALMQDHGVRVSLFLRTHEEVVGYVLLGDKLSGNIFSSQDLRLLEIINQELAVAVQNAKAYAQIEDFNITLQQRVDHATNRLRVANRHLKELDLAKDEFISMASHQLRTPLTTIKGYLSMLQEGDAGKITTNQREFVDYAFGASERMVNLISDLLNVSRLSAGRFLIETKPIDIVAMVSDEVRQLQSHATNKKLTLTFESPETPLPPVELDENKTRQVVMNFIDNAIYYTQSGSVTVRLDRDKDNVRLEVEDTGIGVPDASRHKLFTKFYRADNAQNIRPDGTGLGLYLAKRVVEDQGGTIIFKSTEGKGSTFGFELPFKPARSEKEEKHG